MTLGIKIISALNVDFDPKNIKIDFYIKVKIKEYTP